ncbi:uncharacterized protein LOC134210184 [Armigeres subalbatus]|uniref:uncharacterized protein LOC134210184 n=1 Tax=Armigeres subalbatus TaxID=124917 RepID=UPI002ED6ABC0
MPPKRTPVKKASADGDTTAADEELEALIHNRGMALRNVKRIQANLKKAEVDNTELTVAQVKVYQRSVENTNAEFTQLHHEIVAQSSSAKREEQDNYFLTFVDLYEEVSVVLESWLENLAKSPTLQPQNAINQPVIVQPSLPRAIPTFNGRYEHWEKFKVMFKDVVDRSNESDRIKLYHLEKALIGNAAGVIDAKTITDGNYARAWQLLDERYSDNRRMIDRHMAGLLGVKKLTNASYNELRSLVEAFDGHVENLKFLGQDFTDVAEYMVVYLITRSLDDETKKLWESTMKKGELPVYADTIDFLKERVSVLERCQTYCEDGLSKHRAPTKPSNPKYLPAKINTATASSPADQRCDFCTNNHLTFKCPVFNELSVSQRIAKVKERNVCFNCLRRGHRVSDCSSKKSCSKCNRRHHSLLHLEESFPNTKDITEVKQHNNPSVPVIPQVSAQAPDPVSSCKPSTSGTFTNLLTAVINVMDQDLQPYPCRALLDCGSQVSFITQSLAKAIGMPTQEYIRIKSPMTPHSGTQRPNKQGPLPD